MKKAYIAPQTEIVSIHLVSSVLEGIGYGKWSEGTGDGDDYGDAKEHTGLWGDVDDEDTWTGSKGVDLWGSDDDEEEW